VRPASAQDAAACLAIYRPYVQTTAISWEIDVPTVADMAARIDGPAPPTVSWHGCNSICLRPAVQMDRPARFAGRGRRHPGR
jgi:L-amino acid N-acyltransferase YncA